jgi:hypothetical protein
MGRNNQYTYKSCSEYVLEGEDYDLKPSVNDKVKEHGVFCRAPFERLIRWHSVIVVNLYFARSQVLTVRPIPKNSLRRMYTNTCDGMEDPAWLTKNR